MNILDRLFKGIEDAGTAFAKNAVNDAILQSDQSVPELLEMLNALADAPLEDLLLPPEFNGHLYAFHILTELREKQAHLPLLQLCLKAQAGAPELFGRFLEEDYLERALAATCNGRDLSGLEMLIEDNSLDVKVRISALRALVRLAVWEDASRDDVVASFRDLFVDLDRFRTPAVIWDEIMDCCTDLCAQELRVELRQAWDEDLLSVDWWDIRRELMRSWEVRRTVLSTGDIEPDFEGEGWWSTTAAAVL